MLTDKHFPRGEKRMNTKKKLAESMEELLLTKRFDEITVQDICEKSDICRTTFYRHFRDKYDLVGYIFDGENIIIKNKCRTTESFFAEIKEYLDFLYNKKELSEKAFEYIGQNSLMDVIYECGVASMRERIAPFFDGKIPEDVENSIDFYISATIYLTKRWVMDGFKKTTEEMAKINYENMPENLKAFIEKAKK